MATLASVLTYARAQTQTDSNGLTDANGIIFGNEALFDFRRRLISAGIDAAQLQESYRDADAGVGTYLYPSDMFWLKAIELNYTNSNPQDYKTASQVDVSNIAGGNSFSSLRVNGNKNSPQFDDRGDWYEIFPTPVASDNLSQSIRIFYYMNPTEFASTADTIGYPESLDYRILAWRIASNYFYSMEKFEQGDMFNAKYEERVKQLIATLGRGSQQPIEATPIQLDGWNF